MPNPDRSRGCEIVVSSGISWIKHAVYAVQFTGKETIRSTREALSSGIKGGRGLFTERLIAAAYHQAIRHRTSRKFLSKLEANRREFYGSEKKAVAAVRSEISRIRAAIQCLSESKKNGCA